MQKLAVCALFLVAVPGLGQSPEERARRASAELTFTETVAAADKACGTKLQATIDWPTFGKESERYNVPSFCGAPLEALQSLCAGPKASAYIRQKLRSFQCRQASSGETHLEVKGPALEWAVAFDTANLRDLARADLLRKL